MGGISARSTRAYRVFLSELTDHAVAADLLLEPDPNEEQLDDLRCRFHKIKGGAGFFGLSDLAHCAAQLEELLKDSDALEMFNDSEKKARAVDLVAELKLAARTAPEPV